MKKFQCRFPTNWCWVNYRSNICCVDGIIFFARLHQFNFSPPVFMWHCNFLLYCTALTIVSRSHRRKFVEQEAFLDYIMIIWEINLNHFWLYLIPMSTRRKKIRGDDNSRGAFADTFSECFFYGWLCKFLPMKKQQ